MIDSDRLRAKKWIANGETKGAKSNEIVLENKNKLEKVLGAVWISNEDQRYFQQKFSTTGRLATVNVQLSVKSQGFLTHQSHCSYHVKNRQPSSKKRFTKVLDELLHEVFQVDALPLRTRAKKECEHNVFFLLTFVRI